MSTDAIQAWLDQHQAQLIDETRRMLQVPSLKAAPVASGAAKPAPFGQPVRDALDLALQLGHEAGMRTKDIEGYAGYAEFGSGDRLVVILGHLDVVPVGKGWNHAPFGAEIDGEYIYSRGAVDDKGPTMAAFHAARAVQACVPDLPARVRIVFGCDEESGMECVQRYLKTEEVPTFGFAPDAGWPVIHGEKGIVNYTVRVEVPASPFRLLELTGGQAANIVIDACRARVQVDASVRAEVEKAIADGWDRNVTATWAGDELQLEAIGKAAHGSEPWYGDSAATRLLRRLFEIAPLPAKKLHKELLKLAHVSGVGLGIHGRDEASGDLTCNLGLCSTQTDG
ncbi:MAG: Sapep family Mn(2+)-dependent dipeptidase, partial [Planctomycetota bacterium]